MGWLWPCPQILIPDWKGFPRTNPIAYWALSSVTKEKKFYSIDTWRYCPPVHLAQLDSVYLLNMVIDGTQQLGVVLAVFAQGAMNEPTLVSLEQL